MWLTHLLSCSSYHTSHSLITVISFHNHFHGLPINAQYTGSSFRCKIISLHSLQCVMQYPEPVSVLTYLTIHIGVLLHCSFSSATRKSVSVVKTFEDKETTMFLLMDMIDWRNTGKWLPWVYFNLSFTRSLAHLSLYHYRFMIVIKAIFLFRKTS